MTKIINESLLYLWDQRTLYLGDLSDLLEVNPAASSLLIGLEDDFEIWTSSHEERIRTRSALIPAGVCASANNFEKPVAICYLDPCNQDFRALIRNMNIKVGGVYLECSYIDKQIAALNKIYREKTPAENAYSVLLNDILPLESNYPPQPKYLDAIQESIHIIKSHPTENISNRSIAEQIGTLSERQLQRYFKEIVGIPIRRFRLWHRLFVTATLMGFGMSLTDASIEAGFSDASHFSHTFRSMLGMKPSFVLKRRHAITIYMGGDNATPLPHHI